jgi:hypothetical protein
MKRSDGLIQANLALVVMTLLHDADHVRQGRPLTMALHIFGAGAVIAVLVSLVLAVIHHRLAAHSAVAVGAAGVITLPLVHLVPHWSALSDPYPAAHVDALSWLVLALLIAASLLLLAVGVQNLRSARPQTTRSVAGVSGT